MFLGNLTEEQRLSKAVVKIMDKAPYLSAVLMIGRREITDNPKTRTAYTNGKDEFYSRTFVASLNDAELRFLVLHEVYHKLFKHLTTWKHLWEKDADRTNRAADHVINIKIVDEFSQDGFATMTGVLEGGCYDRQYVGMSTQEVFNLLPPGNGGGGGGRGGDGGGGVSQPTNEQGQQPFDDHDWEAAKEMTEEDKRELERDIDEAVRQGSTIAGKVGSGGNRDLDELLKTKVDWRQALREFVQNTCTGKDFSTFKRLNRRYISKRIAMPSGVQETVTCLAEHNDMSGSIGAREQQIMISELAAICEQVKPDELHVSYWDTQVCGYEKYVGAEIADVASKTKPVGGGGTDVTCVPEYLKQHKIEPQASIVFTDGHLYGGWGEWDHPVLWVIVDNPNATPDHGAVLHVDSEDIQ